MDVEEFRKLAQTYNFNDNLQKVAFLCQLVLSGVRKETVLQIKNELFSEVE